MNHEQKDIKEFSIGELFSQSDYYLIPIYQRNYAWGKGQVEQLVKDIEDFAKKNKERDYYLGTLVVYEKSVGKDKIYETIDGQQRLTTLSILLSVLKKEQKDLFFHPLLRYESRKESTQTLQYIYEGEIDEKESFNPAMKKAYDVITNALKNLSIELTDFREYLLKNVKILRVNVPKDTDLNHYFEVMNNRGEQLEKHEILKARMLSELTNEDEKYTFSLIWEACSDMERYIQYGFRPNQREIIFGEMWNTLACENFNDINKKLTNSKIDRAKENSGCSIDDILGNSCEVNIGDKEKKNKDEEKPDRFTSPVNFQNFLLHVWKITQNKKIPLDDKVLLEVIDGYSAEQVRKFGYDLLKLRFLLDSYILKRELIGEKDDWSLQVVYKSEYTKGNRTQKKLQFKNRFENQQENQQILMLLSMFHVSNPSRTYKYWLTGALNYLYHSVEITFDSYKKFLEIMAENFLMRYLSRDPMDYDNLIFSIEEKNFEYSIDSTLLNRGTAVEHFIFNYLDYLLWKKNLESKERDFSYFRFSFSNSVEHFYPQNPINGFEKLDKETLDSFGNLCLMSSHKNAKLNNHPPKSKKEYYRDGNYDSIKQHYMMEKADEWNEKAIKEHQKEMLDILGVS